MFAAPYQAAAFLGVGLAYLTRRGRNRAVSSTYPDVSIPKKSLVEFVLEHCPKFGAKPAFIDGVSGRKYTFEQIPMLVKRAAAGLQAQGFKKGDCCLMLAPNLPEYPLMFLAILYAGGVVTTANPLATADDLRKQIKDSGATFAATIPLFMGKLAEADSSLKVITFGDQPNSSAVSFLSLISSDPLAAPVAVDPENDVVALPYSSGTTGFPKGVMLTSRNMLANICQLSFTEPSLVKLTPDDVMLGVLPFFHIYGLTCIMLSALVVGFTVIVMPKFDMGEMLSHIQAYKITIAHLVPPIMLALAKHPVVDKYDLSSLRFLVSGAAPLGADVINAVSQRLSVVVGQGYGMTESSPVTFLTANVGSKPVAAKSKPGSCGTLLPSTQAKIVGPNGKTLKRGEEGELLVKGPQVMKGYLNNPTATAETIDADGWLHTGDMGYLDNDDCLFVVDRIKELIKYKGYQVAPAELEATLLEMPGIVDAAVIGKPDEEAGELPVAFVVRSDTGPSVSEQEILDYMAGKVAPYKRIRNVHFLAHIPKSTSGKILRKELRPLL